MHPKIVTSRPGNCPACGMKLVLAGQAKVDADGCAHHESGCCATETAAPHAGCSHEAQTK